MNELKTEVTAKPWVIMMHKNPDLDAIESATLIHRYGGQKYPGAESFPVRFSISDVLGSDTDHDRDHVIVVDCGHGRYSDKQGENARTENECAATLVAADLGIRNNPELSRLLAITLKRDQATGTTSTELAELVKVANRSWPEGNANVVLRTERLLEAIVHQEQYSCGPVPGEKSLRDIFDIIAAEEGSVIPAEGPIRQRLLSSIGESMKRKDEVVTELAHVVECLFRSGCAMTDVLPMLRFWFNMMIKDQQDFWKEVEKYRRLPFVPVCVLQHGREERIKLLVIDNADSSNSHKAAFRVGADIVLVCDSRGNVRIHTKSATAHGLELDNLAAEIRRCECGIRDNHVDLSCAGVHPAVPEWYYFKVGKCILNGSLTNVRPPTKIPLKTLTDLIQHCLHPQGLAKLREMRQPRKSVARRSDTKGLRPLEKALDSARSH